LVAKRTHPTFTPLLRFCILTAMTSQAAAPGKSSNAHGLELADAIPIPSDNRLVSVEHPAILSSIETGVKTLGGDEALNKVHHACFFLRSNV